MNTAERAIDTMESVLHMRGYTTEQIAKSKTGSLIKKGKKILAQLVLVGTGKQSKLHATNRVEKRRLERDKRRIEWPYIVNGNQEGSSVAVFTMPQCLMDAMRACADYCAVNKIASFIALTETPPGFHKIVFRGVIEENDSRKSTESIPYECFTYKRVQVNWAKHYAVPEHVPLQADSPIVKGFRRRVGPSIKLQVILEDDIQARLLGSVPGTFMMVGGDTVCEVHPASAQLSYTKDKTIRSSWAK